MKIAADKLYTCQSDYIVFGKGAGAHGLAQLAGIACRRRTSAGADGAAFISSVKGNTAVIEAYNANGSLSELCDGAVRACAQLLYINNIFTGNSASIICNGKKCELLRLSDTLIKTQYPLPSFTPEDIKPLKSTKPVIGTLCEVCGGGVYVYAVYSGMPFAVVLTDNIENIDVEKRGEDFQASRSFNRGINLVYMQKADFETIRLRAYRYGTGEVPSCANAAIAAHECAIRLGLCRQDKVTALFKTEAIVCERTKTKASALAETHYAAGISFNL